MRTFSSRDLTWRRRIAAALRVGEDYTGRIRHVGKDAVKEGDRPRRQRHAVINAQLHALGRHRPDLLLHVELGTARTQNLVRARGRQDRQLLCPRRQGSTPAQQRHEVADLFKRHGGVVGLAMATEKTDAEAMMAEAAALAKAARLPSAQAAVDLLTGTMGKPS